MIDMPLSAEARRMHRIGLGDLVYRSTKKFGWHHTGDLGMFDAGGQMVFVDRKKDMIKTGDENVASVKVEAA